MWWLLKAILLTNTADSKPRCTRSIRSPTFIWTLFPIVWKIALTLIILVWLSFQKLTSLLFSGKVFFYVFCFFSAKKNNVYLDYNKNSVRLTLYSRYHFVLPRNKCHSVRTKNFQIIIFICIDKVGQRIKVNGLEWCIKKQFFSL